MYYLFSLKHRKRIYIINAPKKLSSLCQAWLSKKKQFRRIFQDIIKVLVNSCGSLVSACCQIINCSEHNLTFSNLFLSENNGLASLDDSVALCFCLGALEFKHNLFGLFGLLSEDGLGLTAVTFLFHIISPLSLFDERVPTFLVLTHFMNSVLFGLFTECTNRLWDMYHFAFSSLSY